MLFRSRSSPCPPLPPSPPKKQMCQQRRGTSGAELRDRTNGITISPINDLCQIAACIKTQRYVLPCVHSRVCMFIRAFGCWYLLTCVCVCVCVLLRPSWQVAIPSASFPPRLCQMKAGTVGSDAAKTSPLTGNNHVTNPP